ncbi:hypothetical protein ACQ4PT_062558 [Festuca glaucescens]
MAYLHRAPCARLLLWVLLQLQRGVWGADGAAEPRAAVAEVPGGHGLLRPLPPVRTDVPSPPGEVRARRHRARRRRGSWSLHVQLHHRGPALEHVPGYGLWFRKVDGVQ